MRATTLTKAIILTKADRAPGQYKGQGVYCGLSTASEVFPFCTTKPYSYLCNYNAIFSYTDKREVFQQEYSQYPILPSLHFWFLVNGNVV